MCDRDRDVDWIKYRANDGAFVNTILVILLNILCVIIVANSSLTIFGLKLWTIVIILITMMLVGLYIMYVSHRKYLALVGLSQTWIPIG